MGLEPLGRNWGPMVNWDDLGKAYAAFIVAWTIILYVGVGWLVLNRNLPFVKIRNVPIAVTSVSCLHIYLIKIVLAYTTNGHFLCALEFWIMSIYLPFGIALFQANLVQLHSISDQQQKLATSAGSLSAFSMDSQSGARGWWQKWNNLPQLKKSYVYIGIGMLIQLVITVVIYAATPELQGDWRSFGAVTHAKGQALCRKSPAWVPSAFWQLTWSWCFGLWTLYKIRDIRDAHYWRLGTWLSVISGLPGTPLWIAAVFSVQFKPVNIRWVPPMWLAPGIVVMQVVTVFFPMYEAYVSRAHMRTTLSLLKEWEEKGAQNSEPSLSSGETSNASLGISTRSKEIFSMASLEKALAVNPLPLLHYAASKDFTAENIIFLMRVREWRQAYATAPKLLNTSVLTSDAQNLLFRMGVDIYMTCVLDTVSEFPINIDHNLKTALDAVFGPAVPERKHRRSADSNGGSPWDIDMDALDKAPIQLEVKRITLSRETSDDSVKTMWTTKSKSIKTQCSERTLDDDEKPIFEPHPAIAPLGTTRAKIRREFDSTVFDAAEASIKYLVLTNTWRKCAQEAQGAHERGMV
ncbi:hypothetical protein Slin15195_G018570 [Septoria linicola]|uniref:RGS domain-containing protein n=1 Tax=Septoria linicola TaxID=215465 RepID=A0A9Q9ALY3_9PEZI|nr:hypothetical protein Slin14017_G018650 [Septoria linicola]USW48538.1 hypothetical protein Slin15195_G018570 [Septoria linicola]